jgi:prophage regulatory protein
MPRKLLRRKQVLERIPFSNSTLKRLESQGRFPRRVPYGPNSVGWFEDEIEAFLEQCRPQSAAPLPPLPRKPVGRPRKESEPPTAAPASTSATPRSASNR